MFAIARKGPQRMSDLGDVNEFNKQIIEEFRQNGGTVGGPFEGGHLLILHTIGAKSGKERLNPLAYQQVGESVAIFASKAGAPTDPAWYRNILANPDVTIEIGTERQRRRARVAEGDERERIWSTQKRDVPGFAEYEQKAGRQIPVVVLDPVG